MAPLDVAQRYFDAWNRHDAAEIAACMAPGGTYTDPAVGTLPGVALSDYADSLFAAFPNLSFELGGVDVVGERIIAEWTMRGTNHGSFAGAPPSGKEIALPGIDVIRVGENGIESVRGYFDQRTLVDQLGLQVIVQPHAVGPFTFGRCARVQSGKRTPPGALSMTWIDTRNEEESEQVIAYSRQIAVDMLRMPGFIGWIGSIIGNRLYTLTAWESVDAVKRLQDSETHRTAMKHVFGPDFSSAVHTGVWVVDHLNPRWLRCSACGQWVDSGRLAETCACGAAYPEPPPYV